MGLRTQSSSAGDKCLNWWIRWDEGKAKKHQKTEVWEIIVSDCNRETFQKIKRAKRYSIRYGLKSLLKNQSFKMPNINNKSGN